MLVSVLMSSQRHLAVIAFRFWRVVDDVSGEIVNVAICKIGYGVGRWPGWVGDGVCGQI